MVRALHQEMAIEGVTLQRKPFAVQQPLTEEESQQLRHSRIELTKTQMPSLSEEVTTARTSNISGVEFISGRPRLALAMIACYLAKDN